MKRPVIVVLTLSVAAALAASAPSASASSTANAKVFPSASSSDHISKYGHVVLSFQNGDIRVTGTVGEKEFDLSGELVRSTLSDQRLVVRAKDELGNFDVALLVLERNDGVAPFFAKELKSAAALMRLYLIDKATNELVALELNTPAIVNQIKQNWAQMAKVASSGDSADELWHSRAGELVGFESIEVDEPSIMAMESHHLHIVHRYTWKMAGITFHEDFQVDHYLSAPTVVEDQATFHTQLIVEAEKTWSPDDDDYVVNDTNTVIGRNSPPRIDFYTDPGDHIGAVYVGYIAYQPPTFGVTVGFSFTLPNTPISFATTYQRSQVAREGHMVFREENGQVVRQQGAQLPAGTLLNAVGHCFNVSPEIAHYNSPGEKEFHVRYQYEISNTGDFRYGGQKTYYHDHEYTSEARN